jgi:hypothetical protein
MWFSEKALVFVDTRSAALAVYRRTFSGLRLLRFGSERFASRAGQGSPFGDVVAGSKDAVSRLARGLSAPMRDATLLLPLGAAFPSIADVSSFTRAQTKDVDVAELVRFRLAPLLPFPIAQAEVRTESAPALGAGVTLAQAILKSTITEAESMMSALGFQALHVTSALSAALRGLPPRPATVDLILGDSASAVAVRDEQGAIQAIHLRLLLEGDDRAQRSIDEAIRATPLAREIRVVGEDAATLRSRAPESVILPGFDTPALQGSADPQIFPFLGVFHEGPSR